MSLVVLCILVGGPLLLTVIALVVQRLSHGHVETRPEWMWVRVTWLVAVLVGGVAAWLLQRSLDLGRGTMMVPAVLGLFVVAGVGLGETAVRPRRLAGPRAASLAPRRVVDYVPRPLAIAVGGIAALHLATLVLTTATASTDDMGRAGRQVAARCGDMGSAAGPYPGSFYSVPLALVLLVIGSTTAAALITVVRRPRGFAPTEVGDDLLRRRSTTRVIAAGGATLAASHVGIAYFAGSALIRMDCQAAWMGPVGWGLLASVPLALLLLGWSLGRIVNPGGLDGAALTHPAVTP